MGTAALALEGAGLGMSALSSFAGAENQKNQLYYGSSILRNNAMIANWRTQSDIAAGEQQASTIGLRTRQLEGTQRAAYGAAGIRLNKGTPLEMFNSTETVGRMDQATARTNASNRAWADRMQGQNYSSQANLADWEAGSINPTMSAATTILGGSGTLAANWYRFRRSAP